MGKNTVLFLSFIFIAGFLFLPVFVFAAISYARIPAGDVISNPVSFDVSFDDFASDVNCGMTNFYNYWSIALSNDINFTYPLPDDVEWFSSTTLSHTFSFENIPFDEYWSVSFICSNDGVPPNFDGWDNQAAYLEGDDTGIIFLVMSEDTRAFNQGYWKTHSGKGPAQYNNIWARLPNGADTSFFQNGKTWHQVFWTSPAGNPYYQLAHKYMTAKLNILKGAPATHEVIAAMTQARTLFEQYLPGDIGKNKTLKSTFISLANLLERYNAVK